jgi:hypothetical protein
MVCYVKFLTPFLFYFQVSACFITIFIVHVSCCLPLTEPGLMYLYSCSYTNLGCPVIEATSF